jgi:hypothetical protein
MTTERLGMQMTRGFLLSEPAKPFATPAQLG